MIQNLSILFMLETEICNSGELDGLQIEWYFIFLIKTKNYKILTH